MVRSFVFETPDRARRRKRLRRWILIGTSVISILLGTWLYTRTNTTDTSVTPSQPTEQTEEEGPTVPNPTDEKIACDRRGGILQMTEDGTEQCVAPNESNNPTLR